MRSQPFRITVTFTALAAASGLGGSAAFANELAGFAMMPANTFARADLGAVRRRRRGRQPAPPAEQAARAGRHRDQHVGHAVQEDLHR
jgi:hypothetical protein